MYVAPSVIGMPEPVREGEYGPHIQQKGTNLRYPNNPQTRVFEGVPRDPPTVLRHARRRCESLI
jgi:hypothetical protein